MISIDEIRKNYKEFSDSKIENLALYESKSLRKEVLVILKDEILKRNLDNNLITWFEAETNTLTDYEKQTLIKKIENLKCPECGQKKDKLRGQEFNIVVSFIIILNNETKNIILCRQCGNKKKFKYFLITFLTGWWSRKGIFLTLNYLIKDLINIFYQKKISDRIIDDFIEQNNGPFRIHGTDEKVLFNFILNHNNNYEIPETNKVLENE